MQVFDSTTIYCDNLSSIQLAERDLERSGSDRDAESDEEFDFRLDEEVECGSAEEFKTGHEGSS